MGRTMVGLRLDDELIDRLDKVAGSERNRTDVIRAAILAFLENPNPVLPPPHCPTSGHQGKMLSMGWWCNDCARLYR